MSERLQIIGAVSGLDHGHQTLYWTCPVCGESYDTGPVKKVFDPYLIDCDYRSAHPTGAAIPLEIQWCDTRLGGTLQIGDRQISLADADCTLFDGTLDIDFRNAHLEGTIAGLELGIVLHFRELVGCTFVANVPLIGEWKSLAYFVADHEEYVVRSVEMNSIEYLEAPGILSFQLTMQANRTDMGEEGWEYDPDVIVRLRLSALAVPVTRGDIEFGNAFRTEFAELYLPLIGVPPIPVGATRVDLMRLFGKPTAEGGGSCTAHFGTFFVNPWVRYEFPECKLRFELESDVVCSIQTV